MRGGGGPLLRRRRALLLRRMTRGRDGRTDAGRGRRTDAGRTPHPNRRDEPMVLVVTTWGRTATVRPHSSAGQPPERTNKNDILVFASLLPTKQQQSWRPAIFLLHHHLFRLSFDLPVSVGFSFTLTSRDEITVMKDVISLSMSISGGGRRREDGEEGGGRSWPGVWRLLVNYSKRENPNYASLADNTGGR